MGDDLGEKAEALERCQPFIVRQRGTRFRPGDGTGLGRDHTIFATRAGVVQFRPKGKGRLVWVEGE